MGVSLVIGGIDIYSGVQEDGYTYGHNTQLAIGRTSAGITGAGLGLKLELLWCVVWRFWGYTRRNNWR